MAIGSITVDIAGQLTNAQEILNTLQKTMEKVNLDTSLGKQIKTIFDSASKTYTTLMRNATKRVSSQEGIQKIYNDVEQLYAGLQKVYELFGLLDTNHLNLNSLDPAIQKMGENLAEAQAKLDEMKEPTAIRSIILRTDEATKKFKDLGLQIESMNDIQIGRALEAKFEDLQKPIKQAEQQLSKYTEAVKESQIAVDNLKNKQNNIKTDLGYQTALDNLEKGRSNAENQSNPVVFQADALREQIEKMKVAALRVVPELGKEKLNEIFNINYDNIKNAQDFNLELNRIKENLLSIKKTADVTSSIGPQTLSAVRSQLLNSLTINSKGVENTHYTATGFTRYGLPSVKKYLTDNLPWLDKKTLEEQVFSKINLSSDAVKTIDQAKVAIDAIIASLKELKVVTGQRETNTSLLSNSMVNTIMQPEGKNLKAEQYFVDNDWVKQQKESMLYIAELYKDANFGDTNFSKSLDQFIAKVKNNNIELQEAYGDFDNILKQGEQIIANAEAKHDTNIQQEAIQKEKVEAARAALVPVNQAKETYEAISAGLLKRIDDQDKEIAGLKEQLKQALTGEISKIKGDTAPVPEQIKNDLLKINPLIEKYNNQLDAAKEKQQFIGKLEGVVQRWFSIYTVIRMVRKAINDVQTTLKELDKTITEIAIVTDMTQKDLWNQMSDYTAMARQYGASISGVYKVSQLYYQQG